MRSICSSICTSWLVCSVVWVAGACGGQFPDQQGPDGGEPRPADAAPPGGGADADPRSPWRLVWSDEFEGSSGQSPSADNWRAEIGGNGWGNNELQYYTDRGTNAALDGNGNLAIVARRENFADRNYTSARLVTANKFERTYGRFEARIRLPTGQGLWPAFWLLGANFQQAIWPECGEIDILEQRGQQPAVIHGTLHGPGYSGGGGLSGSTVVTSSNPTESFHVYAVEWRPGRVAWFVDGVQYYERTSSSLPDGARWVYDHPFFLILNVAVGGDFVGSPNGATQFPQTMLVDYVRVYEAVQ